MKRLVAVGLSVAILVGTIPSASAETTRYENTDTSYITYLVAYSTATTTSSSGGSHAFRTWLLGAASDQVRFSFTVPAGFTGNVSLITRQTGGGCKNDRARWRLNEGTSNPFATYNYADPTATVVPYTVAMAEDVETGTHNVTISSVAASDESTANCIMVIDAFDLALSAIPPPTTLPPEEPEPIRMISQETRDDLRAIATSLLGLLFAFIIFGCVLVLSERKLKQGAKGGISHYKK